MKFFSKKSSGTWWTKPKKTLAFVLWKRVDNCNTIELIIYDVETFKQEYAAHKHLTKDQNQYYWTRENLLNC